MSILGHFRKTSEAGKLRLPRVLHAMEMMLVKEQGSDIDRDRDLDWEYEHMQECSRIAKALAPRRGIDPELAACAVAVQNIARILNGRTENHAESGYHPAKQLFESLGCFTPREIEQMAVSVRNHSKKDMVHTPFDELAKDVDVYVRWVKGSEIARPYDQRRLGVVQADLLKGKKR
jgi:uncharacterized protein